MSAPTPIGKSRGQQQPGQSPATNAPRPARPSSNRGQSTPYFSDNKRSEVNELRTTLNTREVQSDPKRYRDACQKVIHYMTLGIDVSRLFTEMIMASASKDLVQKKLVYLYLCNYAESHSDLTLLAINTLQKNCRDGNPMVRGLALRSMCGLRVEGLVEYVLQPLQDGLRDKSPYVRKTAVMGCVKLFYTSEAVIHECNIPDTLYSLLRDRDALVVANAVVALEEILAAKGGISLTKEIAHRLLNGVKDFPVWSQCVLMGILMRYVPEDEDEVFDIINILDDRLKHANSGVVLGAANLFLNYTRNMDPELVEEIYERLKTPLITLMASGAPELAFVMLHHIELLLTRCPGLLEKDYQSFFCRYNEPRYVKSKKLEILTMIASASNMKAIVEELAAYITDVDVTMARESIKAMSKIAVRFSSAIEHIVGMLLLFLDLDTIYITADTVIVLQHILRKYPDMSAQILEKIPPLAISSDLDEEPDARCAIIWMLGEYASEIEDAPYLLETLVEHAGDELSNKVRLQLLQSTMKCFFARPPEMQATLGKLLQLSIDEDLHPDVHDRALLYYRLLQSSIDEARRVVATRYDAVLEFAEQEDVISDAVFEEFNSLSVIYGQPSATFLDLRPPFSMVGVAQSQRQELADLGDFEGIAVGQQGGAPSSGNDQPLIDMNMGQMDSGNMPMNPNPTLSAADFERKWMGSEMSLSIKDVLKEVPTTAQFEQLMTAGLIKTLASQPPQNGLLKFFLFAQELSSNEYHLLEIIIDVTTKMLTANFKSDTPDNAPEMAVVFRGALSGAFDDM